MKSLVHPPALWLLTASRRRQPPALRAGSATRRAKESRARPREMPGRSLRSSCADTVSRHRLSAVEIIEQPFREQWSRSERFFHQRIDGSAIGVADRPAYLLFA